MGAGWGMTQPLSKIAVSTGYGHFGLVFWQLLIGAGLMGLVCLFRRTALPLSLRHLRLYLIIALIGTVVPNTLSYQAAVHLPAGIMSLLLSVIPMFAFGIALLIGNDSFVMRRMVGLLFGLAGVADDHPARLGSRPTGVGVLGGGLSADRALLCV